MFMCVRLNELGVFGASADALRELFARERRVRFLATERPFSLDTFGFGLLALAQANGDVDDLVAGDRTLGLRSHDRLPSAPGNWDDALRLLGHDAPLDEGRPRAASCAKIERARIMSKL
jgi:hypothetical protein